MILTNGVKLTYTLFWRLDYLLKINTHFVIYTQECVRGTDHIAVTTNWWYLILTQFFSNNIIQIPVPQIHKNTLRRPKRSNLSYLYYSLLKSIFPNSRNRLKRNESLLESYFLRQFDSFSSHKRTIHLGDGECPIPCTTTNNGWQLSERGGPPLTDRWPDSRNRTTLWARTPTASGLLFSVAATRRAPLQFTNPTLSISY